MSTKHYNTCDHTTDCGDCKANKKLMCRYEKKDSKNFFAVFSPYMITAVIGLVITGYGYIGFAWLAFAVFFFVVWEASILCSHCPYWALPGRTLRCHANYGVIKLMKYKPGPMSKSEQIQFIIGALTLVLFPIPFVIIGGEYILAIVMVTMVFGGLRIMRSFICSRCINFSCPSNTVPKENKDMYLRKNDVMRKAWEESGYRLD